MKAWIVKASQPHVTSNDELQRVIWINESCFDLLASLFTSNVRTQQWLYGQMPEAFRTEEIKKRFGIIWPHGMWWNLWHGPEAERCWALIDGGAKTDNIEERKKIYLEVQRILSEECIPHISAIHVKQLAAMTEHVQGFDQGFGGRIYLERIRKTM